MSSLLLRCEASAVLGTGHVLRCLALAHEWMRRGGRAVFALVEPEAAMSARIRASGATIEKLPATPGSAADAAATAALARRLEARWVVLDGPMFGAGWDAAWPGEVRLLRIDDNGLARPFRADLVLNQNLGATAADYPAKAGPCCLLLGPEYALVRPEFLAVAAGGATRDSRIVVTLGGSDPACATERVLAALLLPETQSVEADFIIGAANPRQAVLTAAISIHSPRIQSVVAPADLPARFTRAPLAVTAGGTTLYELALLHTPMLLLCTADNQRRTCEKFAVAGAAQLAGWHGAVAPAELARMVAALLADRPRRVTLAASAGRLVDGHGASRVVETMSGGAA
jgi:UDP-2,4-diacetamido-2,4,6-trideoxy-beta-L-altropyranose hydrolase